jgi:hypothetical protein
MDPAAANPEGQNRRQQLVKEREAQKRAWLDAGSNDLREAWVSICSSATTHAVQDFRLVDVIDAIRQGRITIWDTRSGPVDFDLAERQEQVRQLYAQGVAEAKILNRQTAKKILDACGSDVAPESVTLVFAQPKGNEKKFVVTQIEVDGEKRAAPAGYVYIKPEVLGKKKADELKKRTPAAIFAGFFNPERNSDYFLRATGLYPLDFDGVNDLDAVRALVCADENVACAFISITGSGLKPCVRGPSARTAFEYSEYYERIAVLKAKAWGLRTEIDRATRDCARLCFLPHDAEAFSNWDAAALTLEDLPEAVSSPEPPPEAGTSRKKSSPKTDPAPGGQAPQSAAELPLEINWGDAPHLRWEDISLARCLDAMRYIDPCCAREPWRIVGAALKLGYGDETFSYFDLWSSHGGAAYNGTEDCRKLWDGHKRGDDGNGNVVTPKSILKMARQNGWKQASQRREGEKAGPETDDQGRVLLPLFGSGFTPGDFCASLYDHMALSGQAYIRGGQVCQLIDDPEFGTKVIEKVDAPSMVTWIENFASVYVTDKEGNRRPTSISEKSCRIIVKAYHRYKLPPLESVVEAPVLCEINGHPEYVENGYNRDLRLFVSGGHKLPLVETLADAVANILSTIKDYQFATPHDKSRAVAAMLTPAFKIGRFIHGHVPMTLYEADESQSGKSKLAAAVPAVYGEHPALIAQRKKGLGSVDESISNAMMKGRPFIVLDNWRGDLDSQFLECILTGGGRVDARALRVAADVDAERYIFAVTSNGMSATKDLCNRVSIVRIKKRHDYDFPLFPEGSLPNHVLANFERFLASVYYVVAEWLERGKPRTSESRHSFREWAGVMDWVVQNIFNLLKLLDGHAETLARVEHPDLAVLRQLCIELDRRDQLDRVIRPHELGDIALSARIDLGHSATASVEGTAMAIGKVMMNSFAARGENNQEVIEFEGFFIRRREEMFQRRDGLGTKKGWAYQFSRSPFPEKWATESETLSRQY